MRGSGKRGEVVGQTERDPKSQQSEAESSAANWKPGDRVRIIEPDSPYTGCRGTLLEASGPAEGDQLPLGYYVAIDGENGIARPFLTAGLQRVAALTTRPRAATAAALRRG